MNKDWLRSLIPVVWLVGSVVLWAFAIVYSPLTFHWPIIGRYSEGLYFRRLAQSFPITDFHYQRYMAISDAVLHGRTNYSFDTSQNPVPVQK